MTSHPGIGMQFYTRQVRTPPRYDCLGKYIKYTKDIRCVLCKSDMIKILIEILFFRKCWIAVNIYIYIYIYIFVFLVCFVLQMVIFNACIGFGNIFCIYEHILKICFNICWNMSRTVNSSRTKHFFWQKCIYTGIFGGNYYWYGRR